MTSVLKANLVAVILHLCLTVISANPLKLWDVPGYPGKRTAVPHVISSGGPVLQVQVGSQDETAENSKMSPQEEFESGKVLQTRISNGPHIADLLPFVESFSNKHRQNTGLNGKGLRNDNLQQGTHLSDVIPNGGLRVVPERRSFRSQDADSSYPNNRQSDVTMEAGNGEELDFLPRLTDELRRRAAEQQAADDLSLFEHFLNSYAVLEEDSPAGNSRLGSHLDTRRRRSTEAKN